MNAEAIRTPKWYQEAVIYQLHVRSYFDSNKDGIGDFLGLTQRLPYLKDLGVNTIWLLPFYPSPLKDDGYDIADYRGVHPNYGTLEEFKEFLVQAHGLGLRVITELVINHTSDQHAWFQRARRAPAGSPERDYYVWSERDDKYPDARIIFKDFEHSNWAWDPLAKAYYWHRFYAHQPDLNFDNPLVHEEILKLIEFWAGMGVDGFRLDAIPYLYEREGTICENLPETHEFLKKLRRFVNERFPDVMLLAEANQWPEDAVAYFGTGDECHMCFNFPLMPRIFMSLEMEDRFPIIDIFGQTPALPEGCQWAIFLRNHDELTLEMVTDEERDYMYRVYASDTQARINLGIRRRLAPLLGNDRRKIELLNSLLFSLPGTPILYYGDEIGMGDNIYLGDRNGVRTPLQWNSNKNAGFSEANPQQLYLPINTDHEFHYEAVNIENQQRNSNSLLWWTKRLISVVKENPILSHGKLKMLHPGNRKVLSFLRTVGGQSVLVVANTSRYAQFVSLDLAAFCGIRPRELFSHNDWPEITKDLYTISLGPHQFFWFALMVPTEDQGKVARSAREAVRIPAGQTWESLFTGAALPGALERNLLNYLYRSGIVTGVDSEAVRIKKMSLTPVRMGERSLFIATFCLQRALAESGQYALALAVLDKVDSFEELIAPLVDVAGEPSGFIVNALGFEALRRDLLSGLLSGAADVKLDVAKRFSPADFERTTLYLSAASSCPIGPSCRATVVVVPQKLFFSFFHKELAEVPSEEVIARHFARSRPQALPVPEYFGSIRLKSRQSKDFVTLARMDSYVPEKRNLSDVTRDAMLQYYEAALTLGDREPEEKKAQELLSPVLAGWRQVGVRLGEIHTSFLEPGLGPELAPEKITPMHLTSLYQSIRSQIHKTFRSVEEWCQSADPGAVKSAEELLRLEPTLDAEMKRISKLKAEGLRIRAHCSLHLGRILFTGKDYIVLNYGEADALFDGEVKIKKSPLFDLATLIRSIEDIATLTLNSEKVRAEDRAGLRVWRNLWIQIVREAFTGSYFETVRNTGLLTSSEKDREALLRYFLLKRALAEIDYALKFRPDQLGLPIEYILSRGF